MFPNVRVMIAALFASVAALICGFGMFAALRVSHEPLVRVIPVAAAPLPPLAEATAPEPLAFAAEPFERRFQIDEPQGREAVEAVTRLLAHFQTTEPAPPRIAPEPPAASEAKTTATVEPPTDVVAPPATAPAEAPAANNAAPTETDNGAANSAEAPAESSFPMPPEPAPTPAEAPRMAVLEPPIEMIKPEPETPPASSAKPAGAKPAGAKPASVKPAEEPKTEGDGKPKRSTRAAKPHRPAHRPVASSSSRGRQDGAFQQPNFATAQQAPARARHARLTPAKSNDTTPIGGPFGGEQSH